MERKKIVIIGAAYPYRGGISALNERLASTLISEGHDVTLYTFTLQYPNFLFPGKTQLSEDPPPKDLKIIRSINTINPFSWFRTARKIRRSNPDLAIVRYWIPFLGPSFGTILRRIKTNKRIKIIGLIDNMIPHESRPGDKAFSRYFVKPVDAFIAMSKAVLDDINIFDKNKPKKYSPHPLYDHYGAVIDRNVALDNLGLDPAFQYVLFFGLIRDYKGLDLLLNAFAKKSVKDRNIKLLIAGEYYSNREKYEEIITSNKLQDKIIQSEGFVPDSKVADYFNAADVIAQPYKSATQSGVTQIAFHFNKPMIVTRVGGLPEICPDGKVGYVVDTNAEEIANAIIRFYDNTDLDVMAEQIQQEKKKYSWDKLTRSIFELMDLIPSNR